MHLDFHTGDSFVVDRNLSVIALFGKVQRDEVHHNPRLSAGRSHVSRRENDRLSVVLSLNAD